MYDLLFKEQEELALRDCLPVLEAPGLAEGPELCLLRQVGPFSRYRALGVNSSMDVVEVGFQFGLVGNVPVPVPAERGSSAVLAR